MATCPYLAYRSEADGKSFAAERPYCTAAGQFVQAMRADVCNDRYDLDHEVHCEIYIAHAGEDPEEPSDGTPDRDPDRGPDGNAGGSEE